MSFSQQLILMIADKLVIGVIIAAVVYWAQKRLEAYKGQQSLESEIAKERVTNIAKGWDAMNTWDSVVGKLIYKFAILVGEQRPDLRSKMGLDESVQPDLKKIAEVLSQLQLDPTTTDQLKQRCEVELGSLLAESGKQSDAVNISMQENRFWLGKGLYEHCQKFQGILHRICVAFGKSDFDTLPQEVHALERARDDVLTTLKKIKTIDSQR